MKQAHVGDSNLKHMQPSNWIISPGIEGERTRIWRNHHQEIPHICPIASSKLEFPCLTNSMAKKNVAHLGLSSRFFQSPSAPAGFETGRGRCRSTLKLPTATIRGTPAAQAINTRFFGNLLRGYVWCFFFWELMNTIDFPSFLA